MTQYLGQVGGPSGASLIVKSISDALDKQKQQKLAMAQSLIQSGAYQPSAPGTSPQTPMLQSIIQGLTGPKLGGQNMNVEGQNFQYTPQPTAGSTMGGLPLGEIERPMAGGAKAIYKNPVAQPLGVDDVIKRYLDAKSKAGQVGINDQNINVNAKGGVTITPESGFQQRTDIAKQTAPSIFEAVKKGNYSAYDRSDPMVKDLVGKMATDAGVDLDRVRSNYITSMKLAGTAGSPQILRFNSAENSLTQSLNVLDDLSDKYDRSNFMPTIANKIKIAYDKETQDDGTTFLKPRFSLGDTKDLNNTQQQMALRYLTQLNQAKDLLATIYQGGYTPHEQAFQLAIDSLNPLNGPKGQRAATNQIRIDMAIRRQGMRDALAGKQSNLQDVVDTDTGEKLDQTPESKPKETSQYVKTGTYNGRKVGQKEDGTMEYIDGS